MNVTCRNLHCAAIVPVAFLLSSLAHAEWISRFASASDVTQNRRVGTNVGPASVDESAIVAVRNVSPKPVVVRTVRFINSRYIGQGNPNLDDWAITVRTSLGDVQEMTSWDGASRVVSIGAPTSWSAFVGAFERAGHQLHDTILGNLLPFGMIIPARSTRYLGIANRASTQNGFTFTMTTDWVLLVDDHGFVETLLPPSQIVATLTGGEFKNLAVNVEVVALRSSLPPPGR